MKLEIKDTEKHPEIIIHEQRWNDANMRRRVCESFLGNNVNWTWNYRPIAGPAGMVGTKTGNCVKYIRDDIIITRLKEALSKTADSSKIVTVKRILKELEEKE